MTAPAMSVILVAPNDITHIRKAIRHLRAQTCAHALELIVVTSDSSALVSEAESWVEFHAVKFAVCSSQSTGEARAFGFEQATAPLISYTEDHVFTSPNW